MKIIIFDTETTGLIQPGATDIEKQPYITDIFCLKIMLHEDRSLVLVDSFESLVKVPIPISAEITRITGITDSDLANQPTFNEIVPKLAEFFTGVDKIVAHNLAFDRAMLANELVRANRLIKFPWPRLHECTVEKTLYFEQRRLSLTRLHEFLFGKGFPDAHRAKVDVLALYECYKELVKRGTV